MAYVAICVSRLQQRQEQELLAPAADDEEEEEDEEESEYETDSEEEGSGRAMLKPVFVPKVQLFSELPCDNPLSLLYYMHRGRHRSSSCRLRI